MTFKLCLIFIIIKVVLRDRVECRPTFEGIFKFLQFVPQSREVRHHDEAETDLQLCEDDWDCELGFRCEYIEPLLFGTCIIDEDFEFNEVTSIYNSHERHDQKISTDHIESPKSKTTEIGLQNKSSEEIKF